MTQPTILCISSYFKGGRLIEACTRLGCHTILLIKEDLRDDLWFFGFYSPPFGRG